MRLSEASVQLDLGRTRQISFEGSLDCSSAGEGDDSGTVIDDDGASTHSVDVDNDSGCMFGYGDCGSVGSDDSGDLSMLGVARRESTASMAAIEGVMLEDDDLAYCVLTTGHMQSLSIRTLFSYMGRCYTSWTVRCFRHWAQSTVRAGVEAEVSRVLSFVAVPRLQLPFKPLAPCGRSASWPR